MLAFADEEKDLNKDDRQPGQKAKKIAASQLSKSMPKTDNFS
jgi:hypothetical protein